MFLSTGVALVSGTVELIDQIQDVSGPAIDLKLDSVPQRIFLSKADFEPPLPDIRIGDHLRIWTKDVGEANLWGLAVQSPRGDWQSSAWADNVAIFTPKTWYLHDDLRWSSFFAASLLILLAALILLRRSKSVQEPSTSRATVTRRFPIIVIGVTSLAMLTGLGAVLLNSLNQLR
ncbi:MAG TPA: hypothetical protein VHQ03_13320 [Candidatus Dormibacteraeota bacterium]|nr:hypothetical protein [Candidatus Dormibacteraeota bacterium]